MTVLKQFDRLESVGVWHPGPDAQRVDVIVSLGKTTLVITDTKDNPVAHWALTAIVKATPETTPATFYPDAEASEALEISDPAFCEALEEIQRSLKKYTPHPGRLRLITFGALALAVGYVTLAWAPSAMNSFAASAISATKSKELGERMLAELGSVSGPFCKSSIGNQALRAFSGSLGLSQIKGLSVLPQDRQQAIRLPGGQIIFGKSMIEDYDNPGVAAGYAIDAIARSSEKETLENALQGAGIWAAAALLVRGDVTDTHIKKMTKGIISNAWMETSPDTLVATFQDAGVSSVHYANAIQDQVALSKHLLSNDPHKDKADASLIDDGLWLGLQTICD